jgi:hypothetical protein
MRMTNFSLPKKKAAVWLHSNVSLETCFTSLIGICS